MTPALPHPRGVLFDFGNTLVREGHFKLRSGIARLLSLTTLPVSFDAKKMQQAAAGLYTEVRTQRGLGPVEFPFRFLLRILSEQFAFGFGLTLGEMELEFWKAAWSTQPEDGIAPVLDWLAAQRIALGVVSNTMFSGEVLHWELTRHGLADAFRFVMSSADYGLQKPHPAVFATAVAKLGLQAQEVWFVGDNFDKDVAGAVQAGLTAIWYNPQSSPRPGDCQTVEVRAWAHFLELIQGGR